ADAYEGEIRLRLSPGRRFQGTPGERSSGRFPAGIRCPAALWARVGTVRAEIWRGGGGSGDVVLLYLWLLSAFAEDRPAVFSEEAGIGLVEDELRGVANADYEKELGRTDIQYAASGRPAIPEWDFDGVLSTTG